MANFNQSQPFGPPQPGFNFNQAPPPGYNPQYGAPQQPPYGYQPVQQQFGPPPVGYGAPPPPPGQRN